MDVQVLGVHSGEGRESGKVGQYQVVDVRDGACCDKVAVACQVEVPPGPVKCPIQDNCHGPVQGHIVRQIDGAKQFDATAGIDVCIEVNLIRFHQQIPTKVGFAEDSCGLATHD